MKTDIQNTLEKSFKIPGQGSLLEQVDKLVRKQQRFELIEMLKGIDEKKVLEYSVNLEKIVPQIGKIKPAFLRFSLSKWRGYDEIFWQALGDYIILAVHRVKDVDYESTRGKIKVEYFAKEDGAIKSPEHIKEIIQKLAFLIDAEILPTDFTRFRRMNERSSNIGDLSKEQAAIIGFFLKFV